MDTLLAAEDSDAIAIQCDYLLSNDEFPDLLSRWAGILQRRQHREAGDVLEVLSKFLCEFLAHTDAKADQENDVYESSR